MADAQRARRRAPFTTESALLRVGLLLCALASVAWGENDWDAQAGPSEALISRCETLVDEFIRVRQHPVRFPPGHKSDRKFTFFLHFPRTAGRSFYSCFLFKAFPPTHRCAPSYSSFRLEMSPPHCQVLGSHDDFSVTDFFPTGAQVLTQFRDPVDRILSAYEFAVELSSRTFRLQKERKRPIEVKDGKPVPPKPKPDENPESTAVNTRDVWPWSYLAPHFDEDIDFSIRAAHALHSRRHLLTSEPLAPWVPAMSEDGREYYWHRETKESKWVLTEAEKKKALPFFNPFENPLYTPLTDFIDDPIANDMLHNGMTFQVLGITNNSYWPEAEAIRNCMLVSSSAERKLMDFAKRRVDQMLHVSMTHELVESVHSLAATLGLPLNGPVYSTTKNVLQRHEVDKLGRFEERYNSMVKNLTSYSNVAVLDLTVQAYKWFMVDKIKIRKPLWMEPEEYWKLHGLVEHKRKVFRFLQKEVLRRRKLLDNDSVLEFPKMQPGHETEIAMETLWSSFSKCNRGSRTKQSTKRYKALANVAHPDGRRPYFSKKARKAIPQELRDKIRARNWLDDELFKYAEVVYEKQIQDQIKLGTFAHKLPDILTPNKKSPIKELPFKIPTKTITTCPARS